MNKKEISDQDSWVKDIEISGENTVDVTIQAMNGDNVVLNIYRFPTNNLHSPEKSCD